LQPGLDFVRADTAEQLAEALVGAMRTPALVRDMAQEGRKLVLERYDWDVLANKLEQSWEKCIRSGPAA
jgi:glycosyltransferase involved in cell wall biosynthesis